jgi:hypothetical protein
MLNRAGSGRGFKAEKDRRAADSRRTASAVTGSCRCECSREGGLNTAGTQRNDSPGAYDGTLLARAGVVPLVEDAVALVILLTLNFGLLAGSYMAVFSGVRFVAVRMGLATLE